MDMDCNPHPVPPKFQSSTEYAEEPFPCFPTHKKKLPAGSGFDPRMRECLDVVVSWKKRKQDRERDLHHDHDT